MSVFECVPNERTNRVHGVKSWLYEPRDHGVSASGGVRVEDISGGGRRPGAKGMHARWPCSQVLAISITSLQTPHVT